MRNYAYANVDASDQNIFIWYFGFNYKLTAYCLMIYER